MTARHCHQQFKEELSLIALCLGTAMMGLWVVMILLAGQNAPNYNVLLEFNKLGEWGWETPLFLIFFLFLCFVTGMNAVKIWRRPR